MSQYYNPQRNRGLYDPKSKEPFRLSRSKIDLFLKCPRCFYYDRRLGVSQPPGYPFALNTAVDKLLKQEFDIHRAKGTKHSLQEKYGVNAVPYQTEFMDEWRDSLHKGITFLHQPTNLLITGGVDDVWINPQKELIVVDYKATAKAKEITELDEDWQDDYKRQMEIYQWLLRQNGFKVSRTGYFVYCNGIADAKAFDQKLEFRVNLIPYIGNDSWVEKTIFEAHKCLNSDRIPKANPDCDYCNYVGSVIKYDKG